MTETYDAPSLKTGEVTTRRQANLTGGP
jgi:hypothetical protein